MAELLLLNPRKRKGKKRRARRRARRASTAPVRRRRRSGGRKRRRTGGVRVLRMMNPKHRRRGRRRNPIHLNVMGTVTDAAYGAAGALALDFAMGYLPLPTFFQTGAGNYAAKGGIAIGLGLLADKVLKFKKAQDIANGALTVVLHEAARAGLASFAPNVAAKLGALDYTALPGAYTTPGNVVGVAGLQYNTGPATGLPGDTSGMGDLGA